MRKKKHLKKEEISIGRLEHRLRLDFRHSCLLNEKKNSNKSKEQH